jgi:hypothetical protein
MSVADIAQKSAASLTDAQVEAFKGSLRGQLIGPGDPEYDSARKVYNGMIDRYPRLIARCRDVGDVITCVNFARSTGLSVAVRGGGHNGGGLGTIDDGLVVDLSPMKGIRVDHATHAFGLATPSGIISTTGVGGLTLGGGLGHLSRGYGLSIDNILEVDVVLADGSFVTANASQNSDLFWAVRGGGGNFGVVTSFLFRLHPINNVVGGPMLWPMERAKEVMQWYREFITQAPDELGGFFAFLKVPPGPPFPEALHMRTMCGIVWCYTGPADNAEVLFAPIQRIAGGAALSLVGPLPYPALQSMFDPLYPPGHQWYWRADFVNELSDEAIDLHVQFANQLPTLQSTMHMYPINGAAGRIGKTDTAFSYRDATWGSVMVGVDPDPANAELVKDWTVRYWDALHPYSSGGAYVNMMMDEGVDRIRAAYRDNYERLVAIKTKYDPTNFFHINQNIKPA